MRRTTNTILALGMTIGLAVSAVQAENPTMPRWALLPQDLDQANTDSTGPSLVPTKDDTTLRDALKVVSDDDLGLNVDDVGTEEDSDELQSLFSGREAQFNGGRFALPPIAALTTNMSEIGNGETPKGYRQGVPAVPIPLPESGTDRGMPWHWSQQYWAAANTFSHPLYFEDRMLERHGQRRFCYLQTVSSAGRFVSQYVLLPYLAAIDPACECKYTLGYYRAGSCAPVMFARPPYKRKAAIAQAVSIVPRAIVP